ncbi:hypothetical protein ACFQY0_09525 [Haloferula chungangensis]|uniref:Major facilitator superfamily (MFS) profile domain-containing protein n=1 Tax=Haloferula chungangensis TaxID=1048331 RepID=A0ABW2L4Y7_9BACT
MTISRSHHQGFIGRVDKGAVKTTNTMTTETIIHPWASRILPGLSYAIALTLTLGGPALVASSLVLAFITREPGIIGLGLLGGAIMGASGALALVWCLRRR